MIAEEQESAGGKVQTPHRDKMGEFAIQTLKDGGAGAIILACDQLPLRFVIKDHTITGGFGDFEQPALYKNFILFVKGRGEAGDLVVDFDLALCNQGIGLAARAVGITGDKLIEAHQSTHS